MGRSTRQFEVELAILQFLRSGFWFTTREIQTGVRGIVQLLPSDLEQANKRSNETKLDQIVSNALQAKRNLYRDRHIERSGSEQSLVIQITASGRSFSNEEEFDLSDLHS